jgi:hypothetical protein
MRHQSLVVGKRGGPEALQIVEHDLREPRPGEVCTRILNISRQSIGRLVQTPWSATTAATRIEWRTKWTFKFW